ncbi:MAG: hypothetical protein ACRCZA_07610 [Shewanella sp.]|uniref:hypothetical protein n=1 Tax=Shewanella sp. TaxID=50422 RepID=UPI003F309B0A
MNKYNLKEFLAHQLAPFASTLKATSYDEQHQTYLCRDESCAPVYDFDAYVKERCLKPTPASPDAIYIGHKDLYFVEFKNQRANDVDKEQMQRKFIAGTKVLNQLLTDFAAKDCRFHFCVVVKSQPKPKFMDARHIGKSVVRYGLAELNYAHGNFYDRIFSEDVDFYRRQFSALCCG